MERKRIAVILTLILVLGMMAGCRGVTPVKEEKAIEGALHPKEVIPEARPPVLPRKPLPTVIEVEEPIEEAIPAEVLKPPALPPTPVEEAVPPLESKPLTGQTGQTGETDRKPLPEVIKRVLKTHYNLGLKYYQNNEFSRAIVEFKKVLVMVPDYKEAREYLKRAQERLKGETE